MLEEIPQRASFPSQRLSVATFAVMLVAFLLDSGIAWARWSMPLSTIRKIAVGEYLVGTPVSAVFLATARSETPESNHKRMIGLVLATLLLHIIIDVLQ